MLVSLEFMRPGAPLGERLLRRLALTTASLSLFLFPSGYSRLALLAGALISAATCLAQATLQRRALAWGLGLASAAVLCAALETGLWLFAPLETAGRWGEFPALQTHPTWTYALKPRQRVHLRYNNYDYYVETNSLGLNGPEIGIERPTPDTLRILILGDAFSMPEGMSFAEGYAARLEHKLAGVLAPRPVQVINAGVTGYGPAQQYPQLRDLAPLLKPEVVIYQFFVDEFAQAGATPESRLASIGLAGDADQRLLQRSQTKARLDWMTGIIKEQLTGRPNPARYDKALLAFYATGPTRFYSAENLALLRSYLAGMQAVCAEVRATLIIFYTPGAVEVARPTDLAYFPWDQDLSDATHFDLDRPYANLRQITTALGIPLIDLREPLREAAEQPVYFRASWHWNQAGHRAVAAFIAAELERLGLLGAPAR